MRLSHYILPLFVATSCFCSNFVNEEKTTPSHSILRLADDTIMDMVSYLPLEDVVNIRSISKYFNELGENDQFWKGFESHFCYFESQFFGFPCKKKIACLLENHHILLNIVDFFINKNGGSDESVENIKPLFLNIIEFEKLNIISFEGFSDTKSIDNENVKHSLKQYLDENHAGWTSKGVLDLLVYTTNFYDYVGSRIQHKYLEHEISKLKTQDEKKIYIFKFAHSLSLEEKSELQAQSCQYFLKYLYENILKDESLAAKQKEFLTDSDNLFFKQNVAYSLSSELMELSLTGDKRKDIESIRNRLIKQLLEKEFPLDDFLIHVYFQNSHPKYFLRNCMDNVKEELTDQAPASEEEQKNFLNDLLMVKKIMGTHAYTKPEYINLLESKVLDDQNLSVEKKLEYIEKKYGNTFASVYAKFGVIKNSIYGAPISECGVLRSLELIKKLLIETKFLGSFCDIMTIVHSAHDNSSYKFPHYTITNFNAEEFIDSLERK